MANLVFVGAAKKKTAQFKPSFAALFVVAARVARSGGASRVRVYGKHFVGKLYSTL